MQKNTSISLMYAQLTFRYHLRKNHLRKNANSWIKKYIFKILYAIFFTKFEIFQHLNAVLINLQIFSDENKYRLV